MFRFMMTCYSSMMRALKCTTLPLVALQIHTKKKIEAIFVHLPVSPQSCGVLSTRGVILRISRPFLTGLFSLDSHVTAQYLGTKRQVQNNLLKAECELHLLLCAGLDCVTPPRHSTVLLLQCHPTNLFPFTAHMWCSSSCWFRTNSSFAWKANISYGFYL